MVLPNDLPYPPPVSLPIHHGAASILRGALMCCKAMTAECLSCATGQDAVRFCSDMRHARIPGCGEVLNKAVEQKQNHIVDGLLNKFVEKAAQVVGGVDAKAKMDNYLERNPDVARKNLANLSSEAFDTLAGLKHSLFEPKTTDTPTMEQETTDDVSTSDHAPLRLVDDAPKNHQSGAAHGSLPDESAIGTALSSFGNPWLIAGVALLVTAISTGVAFGALCHARLNRTAREPLLSTLLTDVEVGRRPTGGSIAD